MPTNISEFTEAMDAILSEIKSAKKDADKSKPIPFGLERINKRSTAAARFQELNEREKRDFIQKNGQRETVRMMRGRDNATLN